jgi:hypothetical protein
MNQDLLIWAQQKAPLKACLASEKILADAFKRMTVKEGGVTIPISNPAFSNCQAQIACTNTRYTQRKLSTAGDAQGPVASMPEIKPPSTP